MINNLHKLNKLKLLVGYFENSTCKHYIKKSKKNVQKFNISHLNVDVTYNCTLSCAECNRNIPFFKGANIDLNVDDMIRDLKILCQVIDIDWLQFEGGEPTLNDDIVNLIKMAKQNNFAKKYLITTNCTLLHKFTPELKSLIDGIRISVYPGIVDERVMKDFIFEMKTLGKFVDVWYITTHDVTFRKEKKIYEKFPCWQYKGCYQYTFGHFFKCASAYSINKINYNKIIDGVDLSKENVNNEIIDHMMSNNQYDACNYCEMGKIRIPWKQMNKKQWMEYKHLI